MVPFLLCYAIRLQLGVAAKSPRRRVVSSDGPTLSGLVVPLFLPAETARGRSAPRHTKLHGISREMKKPLAQLGPWNRSLDSTVKDNVPPPKASLAHPLAINCAPALIAAFAICGVLGGISLLVPPFIAADSGHGFLAWRGTLLGAVNSVIGPDRSNIAQDIVGFLTTWNPGQHLVPDAVSLSGVPFGIAMTLTVAGSFLVLCALMALYGVAIFSYQEMMTVKGQFLDRVSWTNQRIFDAAAIDFTRQVYAREGRNPLFVLPHIKLQ